MPALQPTGWIRTGKKAEQEQNDPPAPPSTKKKKKAVNTAATKATPSLEPSKASAAGSSKAFTSTLEEPPAQSATEAKSATKKKKKHSISTVQTNLNDYFSSSEKTHTALRSASTSKARTSTTTSSAKATTSHQATASSSSPTPVAPSASSAFPMKGRAMEPESDDDEPVVLPESSTRAKGSDKKRDSSGLASPPQQKRRKVLKREMPMDFIDLTIESQVKNEEDVVEQPMYPEKAPDRVGDDILPLRRTRRPAPAVLRRNPVLVPATPPSSRQALSFSTTHSLYDVPPPHSQNNIVLDFPDNDFVPETQITSPRPQIRLFSQHSATQMSPLPSRVSSTTSLSDRQSRPMLPPPPPLLAKSHILTLESTFSSAGDGLTADGSRFSEPGRSENGSPPDEGMLVDDERFLDDDEIIESSQSQYLPEITHYEPPIRLVGMRNSYTSLIATPGRRRVSSITTARIAAPALRGPTPLRTDLHPQTPSKTPETPTVPSSDAKERELYGIASQNSNVDDQPSPTAGKGRRLHGGGGNGVDVLANARDPVGGRSYPEPEKSTARLNLAGKFRRALEESEKTRSGKATSSQKGHEQAGPWLDDESTRVDHDAAGLITPPRKRPSGTLSIRSDSPTQQESPWSDDITFVRSPSELTTAIKGVKSLVIEGQGTGKIALPSSSPTSSPEPDKLSLPELSPPRMPSTHLQSRAPPPSPSPVSGSSRQMHDRVRKRHDSNKSSNSAFSQQTAFSSEDSAGSGYTWTEGSSSDTLPEAVQDFLAMFDETQVV